MFNKKTHDEKIALLKEKLDKAKKKRKERDLRWKIVKTYLPSFSISKLNVSFMKLSVVISFIAIITYTTFALLLQKYTSVEVSPTLTMSVFAFFGTELLALTTIKNKKNKFQSGLENIIHTDETITDTENYL